MLESLAESIPSITSPTRIPKPTHANSERIHLFPTTVQTAAMSLPVRQSTTSSLLPIPIQNKPVLAQCLSIQQMPSGPMLFARPTQASLSRQFRNPLCQIPGKMSRKWLRRSEWKPAGKVHFADNPVTAIVEFDGKLDIDFPWGNPKIRNGSHAIVHRDDVNGQVLDDQPEGKDPELEKDEELLKEEAAFLDWRKKSAEWFMAVTRFQVRRERPGKIQLEDLRRIQISHFCDRHFFAYPPHAIGHRRTLEEERRVIGESERCFSCRNLRAHLSPPSILAISEVFTAL